MPLNRRKNCTTCVHNWSPHSSPSRRWGLVHPRSEHHPSSLHAKQGNRSRLGRSSPDQEARHTRRPGSWSSVEPHTSVNRERRISRAAQDAALQQLRIPGQAGEQGEYTHGPACIREQLCEPFGDSEQLYREHESSSLSRVFGPLEPPIRYAPVHSARRPVQPLRVIAQPRSRQR